MFSFVVDYKVTNCNYLPVSSRQYAVKKALISRVNVTRFHETINETFCPIVPLNTTIF